MKKIIAFLLAAIVVITGINVTMVGFAAETEKNPAARLIGLGIIDENYDLNGNMTRGEFAKILARLYGDMSGMYSSENYFDDVAQLSDSEMAKSINMLVSAGIFKGYADNTFRPEVSVTTDEIIVSLIRVLGYEFTAESEGGYTDGYYAVAVRKKLISGMDSNKAVNHAAAVILDNALEVEVLNQTISGGTVELTNGDILMKALLKTESIRGVVRAVGEMALSDGDAVGIGQVKIDDRIFAYECPFDEAKKLIGRTVDAYYSIEDGEVLYYMEHTTKDTVVTVDLGEDIEYKNDTLTYYDGNRRESIQVVSAPYIVYNGRAVSAVPELGETGTITAIRRDNGKYDTLIIEEYKTYVVNNVFEDGIVSRYVTEQLPLLSEVDELYILDENGGEITASSIAANDVLSVMRSEDDEFILIRRNRRGFLGKIEALDTSDYSDSYIRISAQEYKVTPEFFEYLSEKNSVLGITTEFYADIFGRVAHMKANEAAREHRFAYVTAMIPKNNGEQMYNAIKVFTEDGTFAVLTLSENLSLDGKKKIGTVSADDYFVKNGATQQLIAYKTNSKNEVILIQTAYDSERDGLYKMCDISDKRFRSTYKSFGSKAILRDDTVVFGVPSDSSDYQNRDGYTVGNYSLFTNNYNYSDVAVYGMKEESYTADVVVYKENTAGIWQNQTIVVDSIKTGINRDDEEVTYVYGWTVDGELIGFSVAEGLDFETVTTPFNGGTLPEEGGVELGKGDIIQIAKNQQNEISRYRLVYSFGYDYWSPASNPYYSSNTEEHRLGIGEPVGLDGTILKVRYESGEVEYFDVASIKVIVISSDNNRVHIEESNMGELLNGGINRVYVYAPNNAPKIVYAYQR